MTDVVRQAGPTRQRGEREIKDTVSVYLLGRGWFPFWARIHPRGPFYFYFSFLLFLFCFSYFFCIFCKNVSNQFKPVSKILQNSQQGFKPIGDILSEPKQDFHKGFYKLNKMGLLA
jgi:hypothetical protein